MKRIITLLLTLTLLFTVCACAKTNDTSATNDTQANDTSATDDAQTNDTSVADDLQSLIPEAVEFNPADYAGLTAAPPTADEILGDTPRTFVFDESEWTPVENEYTEMGYDCYENADELLMYYDTTFNTRTVMRDNGDYLHIEYDENDCLLSYHDSKYGYDLSGDSGESFVDGELVESHSYVGISVYGENDSYYYLMNGDEVVSVDYSCEALSGISMSFTYSPADKTMQNIMQTIPVEGGFYSCEYDDNGELTGFIYYSDEGDIRCYDADYTEIPDAEE